MSSRLCGIRVPGGLATTSPFSKIIAFGYDDGPTSGIVRCTGCAEAYRFDVLASDVDGIYDFAAWDRGEELRIFSLSRLSEGAFERAVDVLSTAEAPRWPVWVPGVYPHLPTLDRLVDTDIASILAGADRPCLIVAAAGLLQPMVAIRDHPAGGRLSDSDWFALLGFTADDRAAARA